MRLEDIPSFFRFRQPVSREVFYIDIHMNILSYVQHQLHHRGVAALWCELAKPSGFFEILPHICRVIAGAGALQPASN